MLEVTVATVYAEYTRDIKQLLLDIEMAARWCVDSPSLGPFVLLLRQGGLKLHTTEMSSIENRAITTLLKVNYQRFGHFISHYNQHKTF